MRAAVTTGPGAMQLRDVAEPGAPGRGEVLVRPEAIGLCGSDFHFFDGTLSEAAGGGRFPRILGHEVGGTIEAVGAGVNGGLEPGRRVAMLPLSSCGRCYPCRIGRANRCVNFQLVGIHADGGLQERLVLPAAQVFAIDTGTPALAALVEPLSVAVRAVHRAGVDEGEHVLVLGGGPIGQALSVAAQDRGARVLVVDPAEARVDAARELGSEGLRWTAAEQVGAFALEWTSGEGPPVVFDATGAPDAVRAAVDIVAAAGRVVIVGMSGAEVALPIGVFTEKELDVLGSCCCGHGEFAEAVDLVERRGDLARLISHAFSLERAPEAIAFAMEHPAEVMKVVVVN